jgi:hypothetical protein
MGLSCMSVQLHIVELYEGSVKQELLHEGSVE